MERKVSRKEMVSGKKKVTENCSSANSRQIVLWENMLKFLAVDLFTVEILLSRLILKPRALNSSSCLPTDWYRGGQTWKIAEYEADNWLDWEYA